jgi:hypothetical protein
MINGAEGPNEVFARNLDGYRFTRDFLDRILVIDFLISMHQIIYDPKQTKQLYGYTMNKIAATFPVVLVSGAVISFKGKKSSARLVPGQLPRDTLIRY